MEEQQATEVKQNFQIQRLYVKEQSCKVPYAPSIFTEEWKPEITMEMHVKTEKLQQDIYEVVLQINATAKVKNRSAFIVEVHQAGIFLAEGFDDNQLRHLLNAYCPNILFAYIRKVISDATKEASFPPFILTPINFDAIYQEQLQQQQKLQSEAANKKLAEEATH